MGCDRGTTIACPPDILRQLLHKNQWADRGAELCFNPPTAFVFTVASGGNKTVAPVTPPREEYPERARSLDKVSTSGCRMPSSPWKTAVHRWDGVQVRDECQLTDHEYNHLARVMVQSAEVESAEVRRARAAAERWDDQQRIRGTADDGPIESFNNFLAFIFCAPVTQKSPAAVAVHDPVLVEPDLVFLDGTAASALERSKGQLSEIEYAQILKKQLELAELTEQNEQDRANRLRPKRLPQYQSAQPKATAAVTASPRVGAAPSTDSPPTEALDLSSGLEGGALSISPFDVGESDRIDAKPSVPLGPPATDEATPYASLFGFA